MNLIFFFNIIELWVLRTIKKQSNFAFSFIVEIFAENVDGGILIELPCTAVHGKVVQQHFIHKLVYQTHIAISDIFTQISGV